MKADGRHQALDILVRLFRDGIPIPQKTAQLTQMTPLAREICFGVARQYYRLKTIADQLLDKPPKAMEVQVILFMGLYQLLYLNKPEYATVQETVNLLHKTKKTWAKGLVNAVLRNFCRQKKQLLAQAGEQAAFQFGHSEWYTALIQKDWPHHWQALLKANDEHAPMSLRVNQRQSTVADYLVQLQQAEIPAEPLSFSNAGIVLHLPCDVSALPGFSQGMVSVQDEAAQMAASLLDLQPGLRVLDACCAPGGKTCHMLETQPDLKLCVALDIEEKRMQRVRDNLSRLGLKAQCIVADALNPSSWWNGEPFERILLDAPCSATGVIRRHPDIKLLRQPEDITQITQIQQQLLQTLWPLLAPGGKLVYATCSVLKQENEQQIARFVQAHCDCEVQGTPVPWGHNTGYGWQILPGEHQMDGFFYSVLMKKTRMQ